MWELGKPVFSYELDTAGVGFDKEGEYTRYIFNPDFWELLTPYERLFVICHECLHVILNHGLRSLNVDDHEIANKALDVVVNHMLVSRFGFIRSQISFEKTLCWTDTIWTDKEVPSNQNFEYYFNLLKKKSPPSLGGLSLVDDHFGLAQDSAEWQSVIDAVGEALSDFEKDSLTDVMEKHFQDEKTNSEHQPGMISGCGWVIVSTVKVKVKKKWETVIKKWSKKFDRPEFHDVEQWARTNRRFASLNPNIFLPTEMEIDHEKEGKIEVWFFQDTSGSCSHLLERFFKAAKSLDPKRFDVKMHCFDTKVFETTLESGKLYGFRGTSFSILEIYIQNYMKKNDTPYPQAIFVITDGYGTPITPQIPKRWYWFLDPFATHCIPKECNKFNLKEFE